MGYFDWIANFLSPPGLRATNWGRMYQLLGHLADRYVKEREWLLAQNFALTCEAEYLPRLGQMLGLPRWSFETEGSYRERLATGGFDLEMRGRVAMFRWFMNGLFGGGRWESNGEATAAFTVGRSAIGKTSVGGVSTLRVGIGAIGAFIVGQSTVGSDSIGGKPGTEPEQELRRFLDYFLPCDIAYEVYYL